MLEYRLKGLSCGNCAADMERQIRKLPYGDSAVLHYSSARLVLDERVPLDKVRKILKTDGAAIAAERAAAAAPTESHAACCAAEHSHGHDPASVPDQAQAEAHAQHARRASASEAKAAQGHAHGHEHDHDHDHAHGHDHDHDHASGRGIYIQLGISLALLLAAVLLGDRIPDAVSIPLYLGAIALSGWRTFWKGLRNLARLRFTIDTLMTVALIGAVAIEEWKEAALVAILFGINELLEGLGMNRARESMDRLLEAAPKEALLLENGKTRRIPVASLAAGQTVLVPAGSQIPSDGEIVSGSSSVNEAAITGEPIPVDKKPGDPVFGGSLNQEGSLTIRIEKSYAESSLAKILQLVQEAQESKTPTELFINRFSRYYTPAIMIVAALVMLVPPLLFGGEWRHWLYEGLAVLIVGCPCALILSSPVAILAGITRLAREGILVKGGAHLEQLGRIRIIAFDKTGTLTKGQPHVAEAASWDDRFLPVAAAMESGSAHPLAKAVLSYIEGRGIAYEPAETTASPGKGLAAELAGVKYALGSPAALEELGILPHEAAGETLRSYREQGLTLVALADESRMLGLFGISDELRPETPGVVRGLRRVGIARTVMLTGDHEAAARRMAAAAGVDEAAAGLLPADKVERVRRLKAEGKVAMVGDGINDAPALAACDLGIAMGKGTDSAIETADVVLMQDHLGKLPEAIRIAKRTNRIIRFNLSVALGLKLLALLLTIPGWLTLWIAILSDMGATIFVSLVSLLLLVPSRRTSDRPAPERAAAS
ncbi:cadmium-translocating P-type ATPase [Paenibacillus albicereus]|uniref:Cd(2+)-exporting ATPase n=1 Tax=Paenibacillus albicereus TaxID=2726185 RepID=A0A6H2GXA0_9BACL|nr:heavy metal translocating P-type ATPase [Paenibacillus albicereus]QJC52061.1 cadmium-translocating P-type ATPase [Paenibacillus albicereus]